MKLIVALVTLLCGCVPYADLREYHYNRPQTPLHVGLAPQTIILRESYVQPQAAAHQYAPAAATAQVPPTANIVVQNFGQTGTAHVARQLPTTATAQGANGYLPPHYQNSNGASQAHYSQAGGNAAAVAASYYPQQGQQQQQQYYTPNINPLTQQQQQTRYVNLPQPQQQYSQPSYANVQQQQQQQYAGGAAYNGGSVSGGVGATYNGAGSYNGGSAGASYASGSAGALHAGGSAGASYNGGGAGASHNGGAAGTVGAATGQAALGAGQTLSLDGKYVSQSEVGQLHSYQHQQKPIGDTRPFSRQITTCYPNGQCERVTLGPGQPDQRHQHTVAATRAKTQPTSDKCRLIAEANKAQAIANQYGSYNYATGAAGAGAGGASAAYAGGSYGIGPASGQGHADPNSAQSPAAPIRPHDRRLFPYSEVVLPNDPYN